MNTIPLKHIIESQQFNRTLLDRICVLAEEMRNHPQKYQQPGKILATIFYEPSTRTRLSFETAILRLGGQLISTENAREFSSVSKGESLADSIRTVSGYVDAIALRHYEIGAAKIAASVSSVPILNAGDGAGQHPTQSLLDLYTIQRHFSNIDNLTICMVGDLKYGRTVRSLSYLLGKYSNIKLIFVSPEICKMGDDIKKYLTEIKVQWSEESSLEKALEKSDVIYMTRVQKERFLDMKEYEKALNHCCIDNTILPFLKKDAIVLHPLPRLNEIAVEVDDDPRMLYFEQAKNGVYVRMALIAMLLNPELQHSS